MRFWLWIILLGAGSAATYLILQDSGTTRTSEPADGSVEIAEQYQDDEDVSPPSGGSAVETILPADSIRPSVNAMNAERPPEEEEEQVDSDDVLREDADRRRAIQDRLLEARNRLFGNVPRRTFVPPDYTRRQRLLASRPSAPAAPSVPPATSAPPALSSSTPSSPSGSSGLGGTFPSLPSSGTAATASTSESSTGGTSTRSSQKTVVSPSHTKTKTQDKDKKEVASLPPEKSPEKAVQKSAEEAKAASPNPDELIQPETTQPETQQADREGADPREAWVKAMKIPENFEGLSIHPAVITIPTAAAPAGIANTMVPPNDSAETQPTTSLLGATWKSAFTASDTPTLEILVDCSDSAYEACNPYQVPPEGPTVLDYFYKGNPHKEDMVPDTQETFEIGTVVIASEKNAQGEEVTQAEAAFRLSPGTMPGRYQAVLTGKDDRKLTASFEVVSAGDPQAASVETKSSSADKKTQTGAGATQKPADPK